MPFFLALFLETMELFWLKSSKTSLKQAPRMESLS